jgi:5'-phosphate synthase pdxT subunit
MMRVAVIGIQGDVQEHIRMTEQAMKELGIDGEVIWARRKEHLEGVDAAILPGGESTTISKRLKASGMHEILRKMAEEGKAIMGTCAGCILMAKKGDDEVEKTGTELLGIMDMEVDRNAFGRQRESFETELDIEGIGKIDAVFIRAPAIVDAWADCRIISSFEGKGVAAVQGKLMALAFHPELTDDTRIHRFFLKIAMGD